MLFNLNTQSLSSPGLPGEEYAKLKGRHEVGRVYSQPQKIYDRHLSTETNITPFGGTTGSQTKRNGSYVPSGNIRPDARQYAIRNDRDLHKSQVATATRIALRGAFESSLENSSTSDHREEVTKPHRLNERSFEHDEEQHPIPSKYIKGFWHKWHEDDEDHDADQLLADMTSNAPWRMHAPIQPTIGSPYSSQAASSSDQRRNGMEKPSIEEATSAQQRLGGPQTPSVRPAPLKSRFSWSTTNSSHGDSKPCCSSASESKKCLHNRFGKLWKKK